MRLLAIAIAVCAATPAFADGEAVNGFPNWEERVMHEWTNRARCDPQVEMTACGTACGEGACYTPQAPIPWGENLNHSARFHSDEMSAQNYFAHDSACTLVSNINTLYPGSCTGAASCACVGGTKACSGTCTTWNGRIALFGASASGEIIASGSDPNGAFYQWLFESYPGTGCAYDQGPPTNGHRWNILMSGPSVGYGHGAGASVGDFGNGGTLGKIASGSHYPRQAATVDAWANWNDTAGPSVALIDVDGTCSAMTRMRGSDTNGAFHASVTGVGSGCHRYVFVFADSGGTQVRYPTTGTLGIGPAGSCADYDATAAVLGTGCNCTPDCTGKMCGDDGCGGSCGMCSTGQSCNSSGQCVTAPPDAGSGGGGGGGGGDAGSGNGAQNAAGGCCDTNGGGGSSALLALLVMACTCYRARRSRRT
jgi:uncharacterized protein YkwD